MTESSQRERDLKSRELDLRERELELAVSRTRTERWRNPLTVAVIAAALAGFSNAFVAYTNNGAQLALETSKAESARILEVLKIGEPNCVRENLSFLVQLGLVQSEPLRDRLKAWDENPNRAPIYLSPAEIARFQRQAGMDDDGIPGPVTRQRMGLPEPAGCQPPSGNRSPG